jgi:NADH:ubiquinone oxidoreductase subunit 6 (subunit J)
MTLDQILFLVFAFLGLGLALLSVTMRNLVRSAFALIGCLFAVAALFAMLDASLFVVAQVAVYVGAIATLIVLVVMLTRREQQDGVPQTHRYWPAAALLAAVIVLTLACLLRPDPRGFGTHEHLFLPPCMFLRITHLPCPFCGMTTGLAHMARGEAVDAALCNPGAPLLFALTCLGGVLSVRALVVGSRVLPAWATGRKATRYAMIGIGLIWVVHIGFVVFGVKP